MAKKTIRNRKEIIKELDKVKRLRAVMPEKTFFGDNNWVKIDGQIIILERVLSGKWTEFDLGDRRSDYEDEYEQNEHRIEVINWLLLDSDDEIAAEGDIKAFTKKKAGK